jgi:hypothetical protein
MGTFDVTLPISKPVVFPARCVVCEAPDPNGVIRLSILGASAPSYLEMVVDNAVYGGVDPKYYGSNTNNRIDGIPSCTGCSSGLKWYHRALKFAMYTAWIPGLIVMVATPIPIFIKIAILIGIIIAPPILSMIYPPAFGATFFNDKANFEFKSHTIAQEFLRLNSDATLSSKAAKPAAGAVPAD